MKDRFFALDELRANDVPELVEHDPFEDEVTSEIVLLDLAGIDLTDLEVPA